MGVGVEIAFGAVQRDLLQHAGVAKGAQSIIDSGQRYSGAFFLGRLEQAFGSDMAVFAVADQQFGKRHPLPGGP
eukprot:CAMPEP_0184448940 /NCGR_PEP_ID=MMETSP0740-20130409/4742_1 /TAXON_ID=385413 /ORGANISM="Thalassiosira miniscula, Strain CCMP1093" /LENGTH=73 /DNA_ID=CAMNT_0026818939 /DNA_START=180 /DNA_END=401 /DNA_ORIENTATION=-